MRVPATIVCDGYHKTSIEIIRLSEENNSTTVRSIRWPIRWCCSKSWTFLIKSPFLIEMIVVPRCYCLSPHGLASCRFPTTMIRSSQYLSDQYDGQ